MEENPRAKLLRYIAEHTAVSPKEMKSNLRMNTATLYYYLSQLEPILKQDKFRNYYLSAEGRLLLDRYHGDYSHANRDVLKQITLSDSLTRELRKYRSVYDTIASILGTKEPFTVIRVVRKARLPAKRAENLLSFLKAKNLLTEVLPEQLPKPYSQKKKRIFLKVTNKGLKFLRKYRELTEMIQ